MSMLKRLTATLSTTVDRWVGELENHDAVAAAHLEDATRALAAAQVRLGRLREAGADLRRREEAARAAAARWTERARGAEDDEATALECLRRRRAAEAEASSLAGLRERQEAQEQQMAREVEAFRGRLDALRQRRTLLRSREATARLAGARTALEERTEGDLDDLFERWEVRVTGSELAGRPELPLDDLETRFAQAEDEASLRAELAALRRENDDEQ
jgi:phage shock protein A